MKNARMALEVAKWEFGRFFKLKQQIVGLVIGAVIGLIVMGVGHWVKQSATKPIKIVALESGGLTLAAPPGSRLTFLPAEGRTEAQWRAELDEKKIDGVLIAKGDEQERLAYGGTWDVVVLKEPNWQEELTQAVAAAQVQQRLTARNVPQEEMAALFAPPQIAVKFHDPDRANKGARTLAAIFIGLMLYGVFFGNAYLFTGITGEKQNRVTEQVVAAVSPQTWIDGKIIGLMGVTLGSMFFTGLLIAGFITVPALIQGKFAFTLPTVRVDMALLLGLLGLLGFLCWFTFFAAIAATVDDPNNSARGMFLFLPFLTLSLGFAALNNPDALAMRILSQFPFTSPTVLPARLLVGSVPLWEILLSLAILAWSVWLLRRAAGKIFAVGVLMFGKEPTAGEMLRWARTA